MMKFWRFLGIVIIFLLVVGSVSADASITSEYPAKEPWTIEYVSKYSQSNVGRYVSVAHHPTTGKAYISFYDDMNADLVMAHEVTPGTGNCPGNSNWKCEVVDNDTLDGKYSSIDVIVVPENYPHPSYTKIGISYYNETDQKLKVATYSTYPFPGSWTIRTVDDSPSDTVARGTYTSMKFSKIDYMPIIGYHSASLLTTSGSVRIASWVGSGGGNCGDGSNWQCTTIDTDNNLAYGSHVSLDVDYGGSVFLAFYDPIIGAVKLAYYQGFGGSCTNTGYNCVTIDNVHDVGKYISLHAPESASDVLRLAYYDLTEGYVKYAENVGSGGNCTAASYDCYVVDIVGTPPGNYDLAMDVDAQGYPIIAYMDAFSDLAPTKLNIARPALAYGEDIGNCGDVHEGDLFQYWQCNTIDGGNGYVDEAQFVAVSVSPAGLATIAYSEYYSDDAETYLKVAQQHFMSYLPMIKR
jgi:hypothetical protein